MKIQRQLPQFESEPTLIISSGGQSAKFYFAENSQLEQLGSLLVEDPEYTDREGRFEKRGRNQASQGDEAFGSGGVYEDKHKYVRTKFLEKIKKETLEIIKDYHFETVYLLAPDYLMGSLIENLPALINKKITLKIQGNYTNQHEFEVLKIIKDKLNTPQKPDSKEAQQLLQRGEE